MSVYLPKKDAMFLHIPRCGGTTVRKMLLDCGEKAICMSSRSLRDRRIVRKHALLGHYNSSPKYVFAVVRNPLTYYESVWRYTCGKQMRRFHKTGRWHPWADILTIPRRHGFDEWVRRVLQEQLNWVTRLYEWYLGPSGSNVANRICRLERLEYDLGDVFHDLEIPWPAGGMLRENSSPSQSVAWTPSLRHAVGRNEFLAMERFGYHLH